MAFDNIEQFPYETDFSRLEFNGVDLGAECEMFILGKGTFDAPARDIDQIHVPGRNGDILVDNGGWNNIKVTYPNCTILSNFDKNIEKLRGYLLGNPGYHTLVDQYHTDEIRYAEFRGPLKLDVHTGTGNNSGMFDLEFNCKPERFLIEGTIARNYTLCPYERTDSTVNSDDYAYIVDNEVSSASKGGSTYFWTFNTTEQVTVSSGYFYKYNGTTVAYDGETIFENGTVTIPLIGKDGTKYYGFKGEIHAPKTIDFRMESSNVKTFNNVEHMFFYYMDGTTFCFPFYNPTSFDAYPLIRGNYKPSGTADTIFSCGGHNLTVKNVQLGYTTTTNVDVNFDGINREASTEGRTYGGLFGDFLIIPGGTSSTLKIENASYLSGAFGSYGYYEGTDYFQITPMFYKI